MFFITITQVLGYIWDMLISFTVSNYKSILEPVTLNMVADEEDTSYADTLIKGSDGLINPVSVIYGPNGSGKSTVLDALKLLKMLVMKNDRHSAYSAKDCMFVPRNRAAGEDMPTTLRVVFEMEQLYVMEISIINDMVNGRVDCYHDGTSETVITINESRLKDFRLTEDISKGHIHYRNVFAFFRSLSVFNAIENTPELYGDLRLTKEASQYVNSPDNPVQGLVFIDDGNVERKINLYTSLLNSFGTGITEVKFSNTLETKPYGRSKENSKPRKLLIPETVYYDDTAIPIKDESSGTKRLLKTAFIVCNALFYKNKTVLIDELDAGLHDMLSTEIVKQFLKNNSEANCQMIFTTHNTTLMGSHLLRKDQIWFTQMTPERATELYSLSDLDNSPRPTADFAEDYLNGRYGAVPAIPGAMPQE